jgi:hypothetical protein
MMKEQCGACSVVLLRSPGKLNNWSQRCLQAHWLLDDSLHGWVLEYFNIFCHFLMLGHPERSSSSTDTRSAFKHEHHSKLLSGLTKSLSKHFKGFSSWFTELHAKFVPGTLLSVAIYCRQNETQSRKAVVFKQCMVTLWCHMADWYNRLFEMWPWAPLSFSFTEAVTAVIVWELSDTTSYTCTSQKPKGVPYCHTFLYHLHKVFLLVVIF